MDRKGKWKKKGEERKGDKSTYLGCYSCNSAEKEQARFKVTHSLVILILDYNVTLTLPVLFFMLIVTEMVIHNQRNEMGLK